MKKKIIACLMCCSVGLVSVTNGLSVKAYEDDTYVLDEENDYVSSDSDWVTGVGIDDSDTDVDTDEDMDTDISDDPDVSDDAVIIDIVPGDLKVTPKKKTLRVGESFKLDLIPTDEDFWDEYDDDVWEISCDEAIENIEYKSKKPYYVKVNSKGEVKAKRKTKGYVKIITTVYFQDGGMQKYTTQVYVKK